jgi:hypothetical protein
MKEQLPSTRLTIATVREMLTGDLPNNPCRQGSATG